MVGFLGENFGASLLWSGFWGGVQFEPLDINLGGAARAPLARKRTETGNMRAEWNGTPCI